MKNISNNKYNTTPIENNETAAWTSDITEAKELSSVKIPSERSVKAAKDYVDSNQK